MGESVNRQQKVVFLAAFAFHVLLISYLVFLTILKDQWAASNQGDFNIFMGFTAQFLKDPASVYTVTGINFNWLPVYLFYYMLFLNSNVYVFNLVQALLFGPCLYYAGQLLAKKNLHPLIFAVLMFLFAGMWIFTNNYRVGNDKILPLFFLLLALWAVDEKKHPVIAAIGFTMLISRIVYFAPLFIYYVLDNFSWKKLVYSVAVFVGANCLFLIYPPLIWTFLQNGFGVNTSGFVSGPEFYYNAPYGLFVYLRLFLPEYANVTFYIGICLLFGSFFWLWWRKYPLTDMIVYYPILAIMFFPVLEHTHFTYLLPPLMIFYFWNYPCSIQDDRGNISISMGTILQWVPFLCLVLMAFPIPAGLVTGFPPAIQPFRILLFSIGFFVLTLKKGLLWPLYDGKSVFQDRKSKKT